jgi:RNA polymerase sigma-70 factor, ECF subfamily
MDIRNELMEHVPRLRRYARALISNRDLADDLVQDTLERALGRTGLFQPGTDLRAWLFTILHNQHVNDVRRSVREASSIELSEAPQLTVQSNVMASLELRDLETALGKLQPEQREVILLVGLEGMSYEEVAAVLEIPVGTVRSRLSRGRDQLRQLMGMEAKNERLRAA